ncbi:MAG: AcrB/AcrD/AcrF family protein, partial [Sphingomonas sp.]
ADPERRRGGALVGGASAFSLAIGLELIPYAAFAGAILALRWVWDRDEAPRVQLYGISLALGCALGYLGFASWGNAVARCDALTPVWVSVMVAAGGLLVLLATVNPAERWQRLALAAVAGVALAGGFAGLFPQCLGRPEQVSPELARNWLDNVREARPIYRHPFSTAFPVATLPVIGIIGAAVGTWRARGTDRFVVWVGVLIFTVLSASLLLWAVRIAAGAMMLAVPGAVALAWIVLPLALNSRNALIRVLGTPIAFLLVSGLFAGLIIPYLPNGKPDARTRQINKAGGSCASLTALTPLNRLPAQTIFTFIDLGPRLITVTHHYAIAGPYHRNGDAILDVQHAFQGTPDEFRAIARRHGATLLMTCPNMAESTVYRARAPHGFYSRLADGEVPAWLTPVPLSAKSPLRLWRIER